MKSRTYIRNLSVYPQLVEKLKQGMHRVSVPIAIGMVDALVSKTSGVTPVPVLPIAIGTGSGY
jgi:hypothetical protein